MIAATKDNDIITSITYEGIVNDDQLFFITDPGFA